jgi:hypothetical protein
VRYQNNRSTIDARHALWRKANLDKHNAGSAKWAASNPERQKARVARWSSENKTKREVSARRSYEKNKDAIRIRSAAWIRANSDYAVAKTSKRRACKFNATPAWANDFFIKEAYALARLRTKIFGFKWHVDHIVPLNSGTVCGLHVEHNLQVIPGASNLVKSNRFWPHQP